MRDDERARLRGEERRATWRERGGATDSDGVAREAGARGAGAGGDGEALTSGLDPSKVGCIFY